MKMTKKKYLQDLIEEELNKDKDASADNVKKDEECPSESPEKKEDANLDEKKKGKKESAEEPVDNKKDDTDTSEEDDDKAKAKTESDDDKKKSEGDEDDDDGDGDDDAGGAGNGDTDKGDDEDDVAKVKNEAIAQLIGMLESGLSSKDIAEKIFNVTQESVQEAVNRKTETLEGSIEEKYAAVLESQISELEKEFVQAAKDIVSERIKVIESEYKEIAEENNKYKEVVENILSTSEDFDNKFSALEEENRELKTKNQILENTILFNEKTKSLVLSDIDRINTVVSEESYALGKKEFEKILEDAFEKFDLTEKETTVEENKSSGVQGTNKNISEEHLDIIKSARALKNKTFWF